MSRLQKVEKTLQVLATTFFWSEVGKVHVSWT